jgi:hypothetical protein
LKKKLLIFLPFVLLLFTGCSSNGTNLYAFDNSIVKKQVKDYGFQPKLPTKLPFENVKASTDSPPIQADIKMFDFFTYGKGNNNHLDLLIIEGKEGYSNAKSEEVKIGERKGQYYASKEKQILRWKERDLEYTLTYYTEQSNKKLSKADLIDTAKSFK